MYASGTVQNQEKKHLLVNLFARCFHSMTLYNLWQWKYPNCKRASHRRGESSQSIFYYYYYFGKLLYVYYLPPERAIIF